VRAGKIRQKLPPGSHASAVFCIQIRCDLAGAVKRRFCAKRLQFSLLALEPNCWMKRPLLPLLSVTFGASHTLSVVAQERSPQPSYTRRLRGRDSVDQENVRKAKVLLDKAIQALGARPIGACATRNKKADYASITPAHEQRRAVTGALWNSPTKTD